MSKSNPEIQQLSLSCLLTFNHNYPEICVENLFGYIDNKKFTNTINFHPLYEDQSTFKAETDGKEILMYIQYILYGKVHSGLFLVVYKEKR